MSFATKSASVAALRAKGQPVSYEVVFNEEQRVALLELVRNASVNVNGNDAPLAYWIEMLEELPQVEAAHPGITHGFCL